MSDNHYMQAVLTHEVPDSVLLEYSEQINRLKGEEREKIRERFAKEIEEKYPYMPGEDPNMPGIPMAEVAFTNPANANIRHVARWLNTKKDRMVLFYLGAYLHIGDIQKEIDSKYRKCLAGRMNIGGIHDDQFDEETYINSCDRLDEYWNYLKPFLDEGKQLRIWYSEFPEEMCGFYHLCSYLVDYDQDFYAVKLPETAVVDGETRKVTSWNQMSETAIKEAVENTRLLPKEEIKENAKVWARLKKENAALRAVINGQLISVPPRIYDPWILNCIPQDEPIQIKEFYKRICSHLHTVNTGWIFHRIDVLIHEGKVELIKKDEDTWKDLIKRKS